MLLVPPSRPGAVLAALAALLLLGCVIEGSRFQETVERPACDPSDPEVRILSSPEELAQLNDPGARIFCLLPGDYRAYGTVRLERSGAEGAERHLRFFDPQRPGAIPHPVNEPSEARAVLKRVVLYEADHWVLQGITLDTGPGGKGSLLRGASDNVLHKLLGEHGDGTPIIGIVETEDRVARDNVVQRSVLRRSDLTTKDNNCINLYAPSSGRAMPGNRIVGNEIYDCIDAIQIASQPDESPGPMARTLIADNDLYLTEERYVDGEGNPDPDGNWVCAEELIDLKQGGTPESPLRVLDNRMWGMRRASPECGQQGGWGTSVNQKLHAAHVLYEGNVIMGGPRGFAIGGGGHAVLLRNVIHDVRDPTDAIAKSLLLLGDENELYFNTLTGVREDWLSTGLYSVSHFACNVLANAEDERQTYPGYNFSAARNAFYDSDRIPYWESEADVVASVAESELRQHCFLRKRLTDPEWICIPHARATSASPHWGDCASAGEAVHRCEAANGDPTGVACAGESDGQSCAGIGTGQCKAYPADWFD